MTLTLLLDLDDTLLENNMDSFLPGYLQALSLALDPYAPSERLIKVLLSSTQQMIKNRRPDCRLKEVFDAAFYPTLGLSAEEMSGVIQKFYSQVFPGLEKLTRRRPEAVALVEEALARGCRIAITTNPLFPRAAIEHRLRWAGLPPEKYPFELITSYETFHFTKPSPAYFAEVLGRLDWPDDPVVVIGDDLKNDIQAARRLKLPAYWLGDSKTQTLASIDAPTAAGQLDNFFPWLDALEDEELVSDYDAPSALLAILLSTPAVLDFYLRNLDQEVWRRRSQPDDWAPNEIVCHLRDVEIEVNLPRLNKALTEQNPFIAGKDTDRWAEERHYREQDGFFALRDFTRGRLKLLDKLEALRPAEWQLPVRHAIFGPTQLRELISIISRHDRLHIQQIRNSLSVSA